MARMTREETREQTRERLLAAARTVFARNGFGGASIDGIAERAGYSRGAFYSNFAGKEAIFLELLARHMEGEREAGRRIAESSADLNQIIDALAERYATDQNDQEWCMLSVEFSLQEGRSPAFAEQAAALNAAHLAGSAEVVRRLCQIANVHAVDPNRAAALFLAFRQGLALAAAGPAPQLSPSDIQTGLRLFIRALLTPDEDAGA
ncbi:MAG: TetR/AcrR family transcriptional regulator [Porphyrobacter sp.]|nr:TetR/AcrR family transcriptional regulator [Porphyrobacter sp.]